MENTGRKNIALKNALVSSLMQIVNIIIGFINHTFFLYFLNTEYLGVNGLYINILSVLSFAELGIGNAFTYSLYKPIAKKDFKKINSLLSFFKKIYIIIAITIFLLSLFVVPFLYDMIGKNNIKENLIVIYFLFVINTSISYLFSYKISFLIANQKNYLVQIYTRLFQFILTIIQILILYFTQNYTLYIILQIISTFLLNIFLSKKTDKLYPFIKEKNKIKLNKKQKKEISENVKSLFWYRLGSVTLNSTDNIIISILINIKTVGICSTYTLLTQQLTKIVGLAINSITPTIGNLSTEDNKEKNYNVLYQLLIICIWVYGFISIMFIILINDFITLWLGVDYLLSETTILAIVFSLYINGVQYPTYAFRTAQGLFKQSKFIPLLAAVLNIILSFWWGKMIGLAGIFLATGISRLLTTTLVDPILVFKYNFKTKPWNYYKNYFKGFIIVLINIIIQFLLMKNITVYNWGIFIIKLLICCFSTNLVFIIIYRKNKNFKFIINYLISIMKNVKRGDSK